MFTTSSKIFCKCTEIFELQKCELNSLRISTCVKVTHYVLCRNLPKTKCKATFQGLVQDPNLLRQLALTSIFLAPLCCSPSRQFCASDQLEQAHPFNAIMSVKEKLECVRYTIWLSVALQHCKPVCRVKSQFEKSYKNLI